MTPPATPPATPEGTGGGDTDGFPVRDVLGRCAAAVAERAPAAMFGLRDEGYASLYEQLVASLVSVRTYDETSAAVSRRLFARARTPEAMLGLTREALLALLEPATFAPAKAEQILEMSRRIVADHGGETPPDYERLVAFRGVGPKVASLALGVALGQPIIAVDIHVHRVANRWGYVSAPTPERTREALAQKLPRDLWVEINRVLVPFGKHVCRGRAPACASCPVRTECARVGVGDARR